MKRKLKDTGSVLLMTVFIVALLAAVVMGMLQINTEEIQLMQNHIYAEEALATAEAGLNDALAQIRIQADWSTGFTSKSFNGGSYTVLVNGSTITSTGTSSKGFGAKVKADITVASSGPPYVIRIDSLRINE
jgi:type II secretory pathway component PulK